MNNIKCTLRVVVNVDHQELFSNTCSTVIHWLVSFNQLILRSMKKRADFVRSRNLSYNSIIVQRSGIFFNVYLHTRFAISSIVAEIKTKSAQVDPLVVYSSNTIAFLTCDELLCRVYKQKMCAEIPSFFFFFFPKNGKLV